MVFQNIFVLTLKFCSKTYDCINPSYLLIKFKKGPSEGILEIKGIKKNKKHVPFVFMNKKTPNVIFLKTFP
jgi:hypothetical protein